MIEAVGLERTDQQLSEVLIPQNISEGRQSLLEYLLSMGDKE
jgi:hypothetical protein